MLDELQLRYTSYNGQNLNSPAVSVIRGSTVLVFLAMRIKVNIVVFRDLISRTFVVTYQDCSRTCLLHIVFYPKDEGRRFLR
jgi:hypothetical protein